MKSWRLATAVIFVAGTAAIGARDRVEASSRWLGSERLPLTFEGWSGADIRLDPETVDLVGASAIVNRTYVRPDGSDVDLYVAYYDQQRLGLSIHSPLHCLPGTGWEIESSAVVPISGGGSPASMRRLVVEKNDTRAVVLYWYAVHERIIASEVMSRLYLLHDRLRLGRNDAALVRVVVPITESEERSERRGISFIGDALSQISRLWS